jgi:hypothetical protein
MYSYLNFFNYSMMLYYPCITHVFTGKIQQKVGEAMTLAEATLFLVKHYHCKWVNCEAIPQPVNHEYFQK